MLRLGIFFLEISLAAGVVEGKGVWFAVAVKGSEGFLSVLVQRRSVWDDATYSVG